MRPGSLEPGLFRCPDPHDLAGGLAATVKQPREAPSDAGRDRGATCLSLSESPLGESLCPKILYVEPDHLLEQHLLTSFILLLNTCKHLILVSPKMQPAKHG